MSCMCDKESVPSSRRCVNWILQLMISDLRILNAVDKPELKHLKDCIGRGHFCTSDLLVFPRTGKRPLTDMMSGGRRASAALTCSGDLDGDLYFVCWDENLIPPGEAEPAMYAESPSSRPPSTGLLLLSPTD